MEEEVALRIKRWVTAHYRPAAPAERTLLELREEEEEGAAEEWRPTVEQLFSWTFVSQGPHAALAFLDDTVLGEAPVTEAPAPAPVFVMAASCLVGGHADPLLGAAGAAAARTPANFRQWELVLSRASRALGLASASSTATTTMAKVAVLLLRGGYLLLEAVRWHSTGRIEILGAVEKLVEELFRLRGHPIYDADMVLAGLRLCKHAPDQRLLHQPALAGQYSQERSARVREAIISALLDHFSRGPEGALELLLLGTQDEDASVAVLAVDGLCSWVEEPVWRLHMTRCLRQLVDVLVKHIALPDVKSLVALCVDCVVVHHRQQQHQVSRSVALLPVELQELISKELARKPAPVKTAGQQHVPDSDEPISEQLRKASANCLDILSQCFEGLAVEVLRVVPAMVRPDSPWQLRESGVFLMGIVAEGMYSLWEMSSIKKMLRHFNTAAIPSLAAPQAKLREIACWTVSRFARSVLNTDEASDIDGRAVVDSLLAMMRTDPKVHAAVMTALATLVEQGLFRQMPEQGRAVLDNIILARSPSGHLLDLMSTCFESPDLISIVDVDLKLHVPLLLDAIERAIVDLDLSNKSTVEYLDIALSAMANLVSSMKDRFEPFVERLAGQIERVCAHQATTAKEADNQQRHLAGACTDLCSRLVEEGCDLLRFISPARLVVLADLPSQEGFALLGELAKLGPDPLQDSLPQIEAALAALFEERRHRSGDPVLHNAEWAAGQLARHMATGLQLSWVNNFLGLCRPNFGTHNRAATLLQLGLHHAHVLPASLVRDALMACLPCFSPYQEPWEQSRAMIVAGLPNLVLRCLAPGGLGLRLSQAQARALLVVFVRQIDWLCCHTPEASSSDASGDTVDDEGDRERNTRGDVSVDVDEQRVSDALNALANVEQVGAWIDEAVDDNERGRWRAIAEHYVVGAGGVSGGRHYAPLLLALQRP